MNDEEIKKSVVDCTASLAEAVNKAGGKFSDDMLNVTVREFIASTMAQNHIMFRYEPSDKPYTDKD